MEYTDEQYALMESLEKGLNYWQLPEEQKWTLRYLQDEGIAQPRADISDGYYLLTEPGKRILSERRRKLRFAEIETRRELDALLEKESVRQENIRKEQADEQKERDRLNREESRKEADRKAEHSFQYKLSLMNAFLNFFLMFLSGVLVGNLDRIIPWISGLFN